MIFWSALRMVGLLGLFALMLPVASAGASNEPRTVFIALDAVPYSAVAQVADRRLGEKALFQDMQAAVPLISTFPSTTSLALAAILEPFGLERSPGYEARHFDCARNRIRGGGPISYGRLEFPWHKFFNWKREGLWKKMTGALHPLKISYDAIDRSLDAFIASQEPRFFIYYDSTDLVGHLRSPAALEAVLAALDAKLRALRAEHPERPFHVVLFSDHGMAGGKPMSNVRCAVRKALKREGFRPARRLKRPQDVVFVPFGLVSSFVAYTQKGREGEAARAMAGAEGIDLCVAVEGEGWRVESARGSARLHRRGEGTGREWAYEPQDGDPLGYAPIAARLAERAPQNTPWLSDDQWFTATRGADYPDAFHRIASGFELVANPASVICSVKPGFMYGAALTDFSSRLSIGRLEWTHGALLRDDSYGFLMTDAPGWHADGPVRFSEALRPFAPGAEEGR